MLDPTKVRGRGVLQSQIEKGVIYLDAFCGSFNHKIMNDILTKVIKTNFISEGQLEVIQKRMGAITQIEADDPTGHVIKYWRALLPIICATTLSHGTGDMAISLKNNLSIQQISPSDIEKMSSLFDFHERMDYLTPKQFSLLYNIMPIGFIDRLKADMINRDYDATIFSSLYNKLMGKFHPNIIEKIIEEAQLRYIDHENPFIIAFISLTLKRKTITDQEKAIEEAFAIPQEILSLKAMREALAFVD